MTWKCTTTKTLKDEKAKLTLEGAAGKFIVFDAFGLWKFKNILISCLAKKVYFKHSLFQTLLISLPNAMFGTQTQHLDTNATHYFVDGGTFGSFESTNALNAISINALNQTNPSSQKQITTWIVFLPSY